MNHLLKETAEATTSASPNLSVFLYVVVTFMVLIFLLRALLGYRKYKESIFPHLYDNYLIDYFYRINVLSDASKSGLLKKLMGYHRLVYANLSNKEGLLAVQTVTLIHSKGLLTIGYLSTHGTIKGGDKGDWYVKRTVDGKEKTYKLDNPVPYLREYERHLQTVLEDRTTQKVLALSDDCDLSKVNPSIRVVRYSELEEVFKNADCGYGLSEAEIDEIFERLGGKPEH